jgi:chromosome segregation ATPase
VAFGDFVDKLGPTLASGIILALLVGTTSTTLAWRDHAASSTVRFSNYDAELAKLRSDLDGFRAPGGRFTKHDGDRLQEQLNDHEKRLREQETRPPRLSPALVDAVDDIKELRDRALICGEALRQLRENQEQLCQRLQGCKIWNEKR